MGGNEMTFKKDDIARCIESLYELMEKWADEAKQVMTVCKWALRELEERENDN